MTTTIPTLEDALAPLAARLAHIAEQRRPLDEEETAIKEQIKRIVPGPDRYAAGTLTITVSPNRRFDPVLAGTTLPFDVLAACQVTRIDPASPARNSSTHRQGLDAEVRAMTTRARKPITSAASGNASR